MADRVGNEFGSKKKESLRIKTKRIEEVDFCVLMFLNGYIDPQNISLFQEEIDKALSSGYINFIFDCEELNHISSTNLGIFTDLQNTVKPYSGDIVFYGLNGKVLETFNLLGFYDYFMVATDIYEAIDLLIYREDETHIEKKIVFPITFNCPICGVRLKATKQGLFQCSACKTALSIDSDGHVILG